jgi:amidohydrolase
VADIASTRFDLAARLSPLVNRLVELRHDIHANPELAHQEFQTVAKVRKCLEDEGLKPISVTQTGLICDVGSGADFIALRADLDALPIAERTDLPYASTVPGACHACGHDVHTTSLLGAGLLLHRADQAGLLPGRVRLIFQPAEEVLGGGAEDMLAAGCLEGATAAYALHCDPSLELGRIGCRVGPITSAADFISIKLKGTGGHTSRPHLSEDITFVLAQLAIQLPAVLSRRIDPRAGATLVWGQITAGDAPNVIPQSGLLAGTMRCQDVEAWRLLQDLISQAVYEICRPYGVAVDLDYRRGAPPVMNHPEAVRHIRAAATAEFGPESNFESAQSLGGEDFGWITDAGPGAMLRLGTRLGDGFRYELHQGDIVIDDNAVLLGSRILAAVALGHLGELRGVKVS